MRSPPPSPARESATRPLCDAAQVGGIRAVVLVVLAIILYILQASCARESSRDVPEMKGREHMPRAHDVCTLQGATTGTWGHGIGVPLTLFLMGLAEIGMHAIKLFGPALPIGMPVFSSIVYGLLGVIFVSISAALPDDSKGATGMGRCGDAILRGAAQAMQPSTCAPNLAR